MRLYLNPGKKEKISTRKVRVRIRFRYTIALNILMEAIVGGDKERTQTTEGKQIRTLILQGHMKF